MSVQPGDTPKGMVRCDLSGDISNFIAKERSTDPSTAKSASDQWSQAKKNGAVAEYVAIYSDSSSHCETFKQAGTDPTTATYKLIINFVFQYKDEKSAVNAYTTGPIFDTSVANLRSGNSQAIEGTKTGLSANSIVISQPVSNQTFYIALWQKKTFAILLIALNLDPADSKKIATAENNRIK
ncbi:MAG TPA: hypothetical protein VLK30_03625 [Candidatus Limnocylindrales bacterium]|nr:hypothetical protein [Candidatus Limnocylindrales bacterium]